MDTGATVLQAMAASSFKTTSESTPYDRGVMENTGADTTRSVLGSDRTWHR
jgi:hypothetical protein